MTKQLKTQLKFLEEDLKMGKSADKSKKISKYRFSGIKNDSKI